ncbi:Protein of uncharacterised function (DUF1804) [Moraxella lacunata]|uniref:Protein of uncharacterized function (DUF1804) n=1 Tax=Moraxella lacunata TaxID=477 RepID=A0A378TT26_MORLA|nr:DUF1804 family protein [Moraxella lacunata]STZ63916.1 Protein of uncharacterised function (DUF1804) [Moraxella lacunata]
MAYSQDDKDKVRKAYIFDKLPLDKCASLHGISYATVQRWKTQARARGDDWDKVKSAQTLAGGEIEDVARQILTDFILLFQNLSGEIKSDTDTPPIEKAKILASLSDSYNKTIGANRKLMPVTDRLAVAMTVMELLGEYIKEHKPEAMAVFVEILVPFGELLDRELK